MIRGDRRTGSPDGDHEIAADGRTTFRKPVDRIGDKSIRDNDRRTSTTQYANNHIYNVSIPGCARRPRLRRPAPRRVRREPRRGVRSDQHQSARPRRRRDERSSPTRTSRRWRSRCRSTASAQAGPGDRRVDDLEQRCCSAASRRPAGLSAQVSRLGSPLVNELVIGLKDKDTFNASEPKDDAQFAEYVTHPTLPVLIAGALRRRRRRPRRATISCRCS